MLAGIKDILIITTPADIALFQALLGDGSQFGISLSYAVQETPGGIAQAFLVGEDFIGTESVALILGDNIFYGGWFRKNLSEAVKNAEAGYSTIFAYYVKDPQRFGVVEFDEEQNVISLEEKPANPKSNYCVTGLYFYDSRATQMAKSLTPSARGELEITDLNNLYLEENLLKVQILGRGFTWMDTGTIDSLMDAASFIHTVQSREGLIISAPEEIAYRKKWITREELLKFAKLYGESSYGKHLQHVAEDMIQFDKECSIKKLS